MTLGSTEHSADDLDTRTPVKWTGGSTGTGV
jgi:hypothetical protein